MNKLGRHLKQSLMGLTEIAHHFGVTRQVVSNWRERDPSFPLPSAELACGPVWLWLQVKEYGDSRVIEGSLITDWEVRAMLQAEVTAIGSQKLLAEKLGVTHPFITGVLNGSRKLTPRVLEHLGLAKVTRYTRVRRIEE